MDKATNDISTNRKRVSAFEIFFEIIGWLQIVASPFLIAVALSIIVYFTKPSGFRFVIAIMLTLTGLLIGIFWANRKWRQKGTMQFLSRISATPELDRPDATII